MSFLFRSWLVFHVLPSRSSLSEVLGSFCLLAVVNNSAVLTACLALAGRGLVCLPRFRDFLGCLSSLLPES